MSQFLIGTGAGPTLASPLRYVPLARAQPMVRDAAQELLGADWQSGWQLVDATGDTISELFDVGWRLTAGDAFESTDLYRSLASLCAAQCTLFAWYGGTWDDLASFSDGPEFLMHVHHEVAHAPCEVFAVFRVPENTSRIRRGT